MLNRLKKQDQPTAKKSTNIKKRKLTAWWIMTGSFVIIASVGITLTCTGYKTYTAKINEIISLRKQLEAWNETKVKDIDNLNGLSGDKLSKQQAKIYNDQQKIDSINDQLNKSTKTTEFTYGIFLLMLDILLLAGIGLYSYGIFSKKEGILHQKIHQQTKIT